MIGKIALAFNRKTKRIDSAVIMTIAMRCWNIIGGLGMMVLTSTFFSKEEQGYYYTFSSLIALQAFFEMGLNFVLTQFISHEAAKLTFSTAIRQDAINRIGALYVSVKRWFLLSSSLFIFVVGAGGIIFLSSQHLASQPSGWKFAWISIVFATGINLYFSPQLAIMEGLGKVMHVARLRTVLSIVGYGSCWLAIYLKPGLYAVSFISATAAVGTALWILKYNDLRRYESNSTNKKSTIAWKKEIFPMQWRIAVSWMSSYLLYQTFTPLTFSHLGPAAAAQIGLVIAVFSNLAAVSMSWIAAKTPVFGGLVSNNDIRGLKKLFKKIITHTIIFHVFSCVMVCLASIFIEHFNLKISERLPSLPHFILMSAVSLGNVVIYAMATFMRVHKKEPMMTNSVLCGLIIAMVGYWLSKIGTVYILAGYCTVIILISLPWTWLLFRAFWDKGEDKFAPNPPSYL